MRQAVTHDKTGDDGRFKPTFTPEEFLDAVGERDLPTTSEIADVVGCAHRTALHHLNALEDTGDLDSRMAGRAKLWTMADGVTSASDRPESDPSPEPPETSAPTDTVRAAVEANDEIPKKVDREDAARVAAAVVEYLKAADDQQAKRKEITVGVMPDHPLHYDAEDAVETIDAGDRYKGPWWRQIVLPTLKAYDGVDAPDPGGSYWTHTGGDR